MLHTNSDRFVQKFISSVSRLPYTLGRVAAFTKDFSNPYMWAMYGDNNQGVCLTFDRSFLETVRTTNSYAYPLEMDDVTYMKNKPKLEWFGSLPRMTESAYRYIFTDDEGNRSPF